MKVKAKETHLWTCPECGRQFARRGQAHSCRLFPLEQHFKGKPRGRSLYEKFKSAVEKQVGHFKIESLMCCIHFVRISTFTAIKIFKNRIYVDFSLNHSIENNRIHQALQMSAHRYLYGLNIFKEEEIDTGLLGWISEAYHIKDAEAATIE